ncbi:undecaprenyl-phosphate glucose phosphotransferase [Pontibacter sp. G13]|uniref:undecaprenyl-phosphate glucose phosphotransferase n=1 Tax=Pontibacter sp. G13 TaxID=3074898 RepID=UPI00288ADDDB|nr:undecaprenyl-phosphate glucose phosphotransferase [Pontibacter sp. G13]WNJ19003.1 undecaprenyl-phosphate glucose phosphotransferase [Pontibacter sp. G13]
MKGNRHFFKLIVLVAEFFIINLSARLAYFLRYNSFGEYEDYYTSFFIIFNLIWIGTSLFNNSYDTRNLSSLQSFIRNLIGTLFVHFFFILLYIVSTKAQYLSRYYLIITYCTTFFTILSFRCLLIIAYRYYSSINQNIRKIVLVGRRSSLEELIEHLEDQQVEITPFFLDERRSSGDGAKWYIRGIMEEVKQCCLRIQAQELYCSMQVVNEEILSDLSRFTDDHFIYFRMVTDFSPVGSRKVNVDFMGPVPVVALRKEPLRFLLNRAAKRVFDVVFSFLVLALVFPWLYPILAYFIKRESSGPVLFTQLRSGKNNNNFICYKFRTMKVNDDSDTKQATKDDSRITKIGAFLRRTSLDELPQFINVLKGDMSVVGPRPHMLKHTDEYAQKIDRFLVRHFITPGITGHAQVHGYRGETSDPQKMEKRVEYDSWYIENWSLLLDLKIILQTVWNMVKGQPTAY